MKKKTTTARKKPQAKATTTARKKPQAKAKAQPKTTKNNKNMLLTGVAFLLAILLYSLKSKASNNSNYNFENQNNFDYNSNSGSGASNSGSSSNSDSGTSSNSQTPQTASVMITDYDRTWDYLLMDGIWHTRRKGNEVWINMKSTLSDANYNLAVDRLTAHLRKQGQNF
ncbi:MAG: hypothetical protein PHQ62_04255 [Clostridia bacterium]|nr:hypothetical protein [Clostridia bacterium]